MRIALHALLAAAFGLIALTAATGAAEAAELIQNGSLEDLNSNYVNQGGGCMSLGDGSTAIADWTVPNTVSGSIAWGYAPLTFFDAADGQYSVDLTGLGDSSPNGALSQVISVTTGTNYTIQLYASVTNDVPLGVSIDGTSVALSTPLGPGFHWTLLQGSFVGGADTTPTFEVYNAGGGGFAAFVDAVSVEPTSESTVPEPASLALFGAAITALGVVRRRRGVGASRG